MKVSYTKCYYYYNFKKICLQDLHTMLIFIQKYTYTTKICPFCTFDYKNTKPFPKKILTMEVQNIDPSKMLCPSPLNFME